MSQSNAAAIRRRTNAVTANQNTISPTPNGTQVVNGTQGTTTPALTLPQAIALIDRRLINLEQFVKETKDSQPEQSSINADQSNSKIDDSTIQQINQLFDEFNTRFEILAKEFADMKDTVLKLQTFTMEVNKTLFDERIKILSEFSAGSVFDEEPHVTRTATTGDNIRLEIAGSESTSVDLRNLVNEELSTLAST